MSKAYKDYSIRSTPVSEPIPGRTMVKNTDGGGYVFQISDLKRLERFLILGNEGGTYYAGERELTRENAENALRVFANEDSGIAGVKLIVDISLGGRAHKQEPALFALAAATASPIVEVRRAAYAALTQVARIATHLFTFLDYRQAFGGWGPLTRKGVGLWYLGKSPEALAFQALKYQQRGGWSHADVLRLAHVYDTQTTEEAKRRNAVLRAIAQPDGGTIKIYAKDKSVREQRELPSVTQMIEADQLPNLFEGVAKARAGKTANEVVEAIHEYQLQREMIGTEWQNDPAVLTALFANQPMTAMIRNLGNLSKAGVLTPMSAISKEVCERLRDEERLKKARIHPMAVLLALRTYSAGHGRRGKGEWTVVPQVVDALEDALALSFKYAPRTGKRFVIGCDVSSSMTSEIGDTGVSSCEATALVALAIAKQESEYFIGGFASDFVDLKITSKDTFQSATRKAQLSNFGSTRIETPMRHALKHGIPADAFVILTDNECNVGNHPSQALIEYRQKTGLASKLVVAAFTATAYDVADPNDARTLSVAGLDANVPLVIADFVANG